MIEWVDMTTMWTFPNWIIFYCLKITSTDISFPIANNKQQYLWGRNAEESMTIEFKSLQYILSDHECYKSLSSDISTYWQMFHGKTISYLQRFHHDKHSSPLGLKSLEFWTRSHQEREHKNKQSQFSQKTVGNDCSFIGSKYSLPHTSYASSAH